MKPKYKLIQQEFQRFQTIKEVMENICENKHCKLDSFFLMDENEQLLSSANSQVDLACIKEIHVYDLQENFSDMKKMKKEIVQFKQQGAQKEMTNKELKQQLRHYNVENEITYKKFEKQLRQFNSDHEITKMQLEQNLRQFITNNQIVEMELEQLLGQQNNDCQKTKQMFEQLIRQCATDNEIVKNKLEKQLLKIKSERNVEWNSGNDIQKEESEQSPEQLRKSNLEQHFTIIELRKQLQEIKDLSEKEQKAYYKEKQTKIDEQEYSKLQLKQLTELKQQYEEIMKQQTNDLKNQNLEIFKLKQNIEDLNKNLRLQIETHYQEKTQYESTLYNQIQNFELFRQESYSLIQQMEFQIKQSQQQGQQFYMQIVQLTEEKSGLEILIQLNDKKYKQNIADQEDLLESEIKEYQQKLRSSKDAKDELETIHNKLIRDKNTLLSELQESQDALQMLTRKFKILESDYEFQQSKFTGNADQEVQQLRTLLREERKKIEVLNSEIQKIPKLQNKIEQIQLENQQEQYLNNDEKVQLEKKIFLLKEELQNMSAINYQLQNKLQTIENQSPIFEVSVDEENTDFQVISAPEDVEIVPDEIKKN